jgi:hypothetical protein
MIRLQGVLTTHVLPAVASSSPPPVPVLSAGRTAPRHDPETPLPLTSAVSAALRLHADDAVESPGPGLVEQSVAPLSIAHSPGVTSAPSVAQVPVLPLVVAGTAHKTTAPLLSIRLLGEVSMSVNVPGGGSVPVPLSLHAKQVQLLAYLAWKRDTLVDRDKILEHVFGWGLSDEEATEDKLAERFESHKKLLRRKVRAVVSEQVNAPAGRTLIDPELDLFVSQAGFWGLAPHCHVEDLETIESYYQVIAAARKEGKLVDEVPAPVKAACDGLLGSYPGDFLATLIARYPGEFRPWQGHSSWVRKPFTRYRDYFEALWYAAEYEWRMGQRAEEGGANDGAAHRPMQVQECFDRAAQLYQQYALYCGNSKFDAKATLGAHGEIGERIRMSERALRRCVVLLGTLGKTESIDQVWAVYETQMKRLTDARWQPSKETLADLYAARAQTGAYRFDASIWQRSQEFAPSSQPDRMV